MKLGVSVFFFVTNQILSLLPLLQEMSNLNEVFSSLPRSSKKNFFNFMFFLISFPNKKKISHEEINFPSVRIFFFCCCCCCTLYPNSFNEEKIGDREVIKPDIIIYFLSHPAEKGKKKHAREKKANKGKII